jgi:hypothetical protein
MNMTNASTAMALILGLGLGVASLPAAATQHMLEEKPMVCDLDDDGMVTAAEANTCAEEEFGEFTADEDYLTEEQFGTMYQGTGEPGDVFVEIDQDGDGEISRQEWVSWREQGFAEAAEGSDEMPTSDFDEWRGADITGTRGPAERSP